MQTTNDFADYPAWFAFAKQAAPHLNFDITQQAAEYSQHLSESLTEPVDFTDSVLKQGLKMATLLIDLNCDSHTIAAAIAYPAVHHSQPNPENQKKQLGKTIFKLLQGVEKMAAIHQIGPSNLQQPGNDNLRRMLLAMVDDVRIVLIKLAERYTMLKYLKQCDRDTQTQVAHETMHVYAPLANRLGIGQIKWLLEDLSFRYINPEAYQTISKSLKMRRADRDAFIDDFKQRLVTLFEDAKIAHPSISGRAKHIFSIHKKLQRKNVDFTEIYDASAFRILVPTVKDCYTALSLVHATWPHIPHEFDDYIANPKPNGYRSIHTAVIGAEHINVEIQFRTYQMHEEAELGVAAHWKYKEGNTQQSTYEEKITWLREVMDWQKELSDDSEEDATNLQKVFEDRIYVFSLKVTSTICPPMPPHSILLIWSIPASATAAVAPKLTTYWSPSPTH